MSDLYTKYRLKVIHKEIDYLEKACHLLNETQNIVNGFTALVRTFVADVGGCI
jgi:hypothetical protein